MAAPDDLTDRLTDLEVRVAYQDRTIVALDDTVRELLTRVETLERDLRRLEGTPAPAELPIDAEPEPELAT